MDTEGADALTPTWRHVSFYNAHKIRDSSDFAASPSAFRNPNEIAAVCSCPRLPRFVLDFQHHQQNGSSSTSSSQEVECVLTGDTKGKVSVLDAATYRELGSWQAFHIASHSVSATGSRRVTHISCDDKGRVVILGEDDSARFPLIRIWDINTTARSMNKTQLSPQLLAEGKIQHGSRPFPVAALAHTAHLSFLSIGLADGSVLLLRALDDALRGASRNPEGFSAVTPAIALPKFKVAFQPNNGKAESVSALHEPITGLGFVEHVQRSALSEKASGKRAQNGDAHVAYKAREPRAVEKPTSLESVTLYIVTLTRTLRYIVSGKGAGSPASMIDDVGCALGCSKLVPQSRDSTPIEGKMVIARDEAVYIVGTEGREMSLAYEGPKSSIRLASTQLIIISPPMTSSADSNSATLRQYVAAADRKGRRVDSPRDRGRSLTEVAKLTVFDLENKLVAYSNTFEGGIRDAWTDGNGDVVVLGDDGSLTRLEEKTLRQKLDLLFRKSLYLLAVNVAKSHAARNKTEIEHIGSQLGEIHCKYADSLYEKGDFEETMSQYVKTIGYTQPSYVIRKFLDAQRITNLTTYLQELHHRGLANSDHTTLLLNCFTKLKDVASLDRFIKRPIAANGSIDDRDETIDDDDVSLETKKELPFDLDTAIRVCRQAGYHEHAAYLARRYDQHDEYIRIQIEDVHEYEVALNYIRGLGAKEAEMNLVRYGKTLLNQIPSQTTALLIEVCSGAFRPMPMAVGAGVDATKVQGKSAAAQYLSYLQVGGFSKSSSPAIAQGVQERSSTPATSIPTQGDDETIGSQDGIKSNGEEKVATGNAYAVPSCQLFFSHFINHRENLIQFLETVALARWDQSIDDGNMRADSKDFPLAEVSDNIFDNIDSYLEPDKKEQACIWNTLLEMYLTRSTATNPIESSDGADEGERRIKALRLLRQYKQLPYDVSHALMVCSQEGFDEGSVFLYERMGMYEDILRLHMSKTSTQPTEKDSQDLMKCLDRYGEVTPHLYPMLLQFLVSSEKLISMHSKEVESILAYIEEERLMSPLEVVQMLSKKGFASVGLIRSYLIRSIQSQQADMETNSKLGKTYREETEEKLKEIESLKDLQQPKIFQQTKCNACRGTLDLPIVHFMCKHSFHSRCLGEEEKECPICAKSHGVILEIRKNNLAFGERQDLFLNEVEEAEDGFDVVASMFSKGLFGPQQLGDPYH